MATVGSHIHYCGLTHTGLGAYRVHLGEYIDGMQHPATPIPGSAGQWTGWGELQQLTLQRSFKCFSGAPSASAELQVLQRSFRASGARQICAFLWQEFLHPIFLVEVRAFHDGHVAQA